MKADIIYLFTFEVGYFLNRFEQFGGVKENYGYIDVVCIDKKNDDIVVVAFIKKDEARFMYE